MLRTDSVLVSDCCSQFGRALTGSGMLHVCESTVAGLAVQAPERWCTGNQMQGPFPLPQIEVFCVEVSWGTLCSSATKTGCAWEHGPGTLWKLLFVTLPLERFQRSEDAFYVEFLAVLFSIRKARRNAPRNTRHVAPKAPLLNFFFVTPEPQGKHDHQTCVWQFALVHLVLDPHWASAACPREK